MKREDYENYKWYPVTDETYWVEDYPYEFPYCQTIVWNKPDTGENYSIQTQSTAYLGWGTMAKSEDWYFMIIEKQI